MGHLYRCEDCQRDFITDDEPEPSEKEQEEGKTGEPQCCPYCGEGNITFIREN